MRRKDLRPTNYPGVFRAGANTFLLRVKVTDPRTGKSRQRERVIEGLASASAAAARREELRQELLQSAHVESLRMRLRDYARSWLRGKRRSLKISTLERYATALDLHILPMLGEYFVDAISPRDVLAWRDRQKGKASTINTRLRVLKTLLADAERDLDLSRSPAARISALTEKPAHTDDEPNLLSADQLRALLDAAKRVVPDYAIIFQTMALTGMRTGEVLALDWTDIDEDNGLIRVRRSHHRKRVGTTKTGKSRTVALPPELQDALREHRRKLIADQAAGVDSGWCFPSATGELRHHSTIRKPLQQACAEAGIEIRFTPHGFRRTFNNLLRQVTTGTVQRSLTGHSTERMSEHYSHVSMEEKKAAVDGVLRMVRTEKCGPGCGPEPQT